MKSARFACVWLAIATSLKLAEAQEFLVLPDGSAELDRTRGDALANVHSTKSNGRNPELSYVTSGITILPQTSPQPLAATATTKSASVLRPSIEEVASELSRKYLNLERHKSVPPPAPSSSGHSSAARAGPEAPPGAVEAEQEITRPANGSSSLSLTPTPDDNRQQALPGSKKLSARELVSNEGHYLSIDLQGSRTSTKEARNRSSTPPEAKANQYTATRKRKTSHRSGRLQQQGGNEVDELRQCQQYLQLHSTAYQAHGGADSSPLLGRLHSLQLSNQMLPCSCESGWHFAAESEPLQSRLRLVDEMSRVWLNCDNIQLIGSQLFAPHFEQQQQQQQQHQNLSGAQQNGYMNSARRLEEANGDQHTSAIVQFSQRDADLQVLYSQKFHYLRLSSLRSIDLSRNRLRLIKMDAFHGLETKLEHLNLAHNLLGDSRAMHVNELHGSQAAFAGFTTDELNRLRALKWLSLSHNQINQLSGNIFLKQQAPSSTNHQTLGQAKPPSELHQSEPISELLFLDLSHNLLKQVPSGSIQPLSKLLVLKLNDNKILRLDQTSKFPSSLQRLDLSDNLIDTIRHSDLIDLQELIELDLSNNQLKQLDQFAFVSASALARPSILISAQAAGQAPVSAQRAADESSQSESSQLIYGSARAQSTHEEAMQSNIRRRRRRRRRRDAKEGEELVESEQQSDLAASEEENDLDVVESIFSAITDRFSGTSEQAARMGEEDASSRQVVSQFNATLKLNLSRNLFENIPGDSLLKFPNLQTLDLSQNRIRRLDANYLCSMYNLVDNLKYLDLTGNLLSLGQQQQRVANQFQLNKLFGCLQRLEKLLLGTNRLVSNEADKLLPRAQVQGSLEVDVFGSLQDNEKAQLEPRPSADEPSSTPAGKLTIKFGDNFGSKNLNTLDLSDNRLDSFPVIEQALVTHQPIVLPQMGALNESLGGAYSYQWLGTRPYLEMLNLNYNNINHLNGHEVDHLCNLRELHLDFNKLTTLPVKFMRRFTSLDHFSAAGNRMGSLEPLEELLERSVRTLRVLNLSKNRLVDWPKSSSRPAGSLEGQQQVINDQPASSANNNNNNNNNNQLKASSSKQSNQLEFVLEELNLEGNLLTSVNVSSLFDQLVHMKHLRTLNLNYNLLNKVRSDWFKFANRNLQRLLLTGNKINSIDLGAFASNQANELIQLSLDFNLVKELKRKTFDSLPRLRDLNLAHNLIHTINSETFNQLNSLQVLRLNNNKLTSWKCEYFAQLCNSISGQINVDLSALIGAGVGASSSSSSVQMASGSLSAGSPAVSSLMELDLSYNSLSQLRANSISVHTKLVRLDLSHNKLSFIPHDLFKATASLLNADRQLHLVSSLKYLNLAHNRIQTIDNINFKPLRNLLALDLSFNELQALGVDVLTGLEARAGAQPDGSTQRPLIVSNNLTSLLVDHMPDFQHQKHDQQHQLPNETSRSGRSLYAANSWPALSKLRSLNLAHNSLSTIKQSLLSELSPFVSFALNLSHNYLDSESFPVGFFTKLSSAHPSPKQQDDGKTWQQSFDLVFTLKLESLDLSHNRLSEWPSALLDNHYSSLEASNLAHNRIQHLPQDSNPMIQIKGLNLEFNPLSRESSELLLFEQRSARQLNLAATRLYAIQQATADNDQYSRSVQQLKSRLVNQTSQLDLIRSISKPIEAPYLRHLNLSSNQLVWLAANVFDKMHSLQTLDLSNNQLTRLHLLSNQLTRVAPTLEQLDVSSNLFTSIDSTDFNQLTRIRRLDLSNLLSLQKVNCRFLSKLSTLTHLSMFNYPKLRQSISGLAGSLHDDELTERHRQKIRNELLMATINAHCFRDTNEVARNAYELKDLTQQAEQFTQHWYKIEQLELELFNNFEGPAALDSDSFTLNQELRQLLGPNTRFLKLFGLNLTSLSDSSFLGITSDSLELQISYTSISQLPLRQILAALAKRTRLKLDLTHNNIQTIDMEALQWLDEMQQVNLASAAQNLMSSGDPFSRSTLRLGANPFRCDCQTRPLWLWLNQRYDNALETTVSSAQNANDESSGTDGSPLQTATTTTLNSNYWSKFHTVTQANDLKCFYPAKLRGKLAQHVYYNDLVCKGSSGLQTTLTPSNPNTRSARRRNDTARSSDTYYTTSNADELEDLDEDDYSESEAQSSAARTWNGVRITRFNRYHSAVSNLTSLYFLTKFPSVPFMPDGASHIQTDERSPQAGIGKRDQNSVPSAPTLSFLASEILVANTKYAKHRPNTQQKHAHFKTVTNLNSVPFGRANRQASLASTSTSGPGVPQARNSMLTDSDIMILTVASIAMALMSLVIISVCLFKYKFDHNDEERILSTHSKLVLSQALFAGGKPNGDSATMRQTSSGPSSPSSAGSKRSSKAKSCGPSSKSSPKRSPPDQLHKRTSVKRREARERQFGAGGAITKNGSLKAHSHFIAPINLAVNPPGHSFLTPSAQNFLMRSPTIRRMHGLAHDATHWFKYTLRAYPTAAGARRRRLFIQNNSICGPAQLSTTKLTNRYNQHKLQQRQEKFLASSLMLSGCPSHGIKCLEDIASGLLLDLDSVSCMYCVTLARTVQQTKVLQRARPVASSSSGPDHRAGQRAQASEQTDRDGQIAADKSSEPHNGQPGNSTFQATIEQQGGFMPPKMIQALARRLDERHNATSNSPSRAGHEVQQPEVAINKGNSFYSREQPSRNMRTFGHQNNLQTSTGVARSSTCSFKAASEAQTTEPSGAEDGAPSQIPTIDVDGRFAYQSDSHIDSPRYCATLSKANSGDHSRTDDGSGGGGGGATPTSTVATGREDIFILIRDTPVSESARGSLSRRNSTRDRHRAFRVAVATSAEQSDANLTGNDEEAGSSVMQDECSRTSSPIAYGFMRSSPSATTLSSNTATTSHTRYHVNKSPEPTSNSARQSTDTTDEHHRSRIEQLKASLQSNSRSGQKSSSFLRSQQSSEKRPIYKLKSSSQLQQHDQNNNEAVYANHKHLRFHHQNTSQSESSAPYQQQSERIIISRL